MCPLLNRNTLLLCFHKHYAFKVLEYLVNQGSSLSISIWFWKFKSYKTNQHTNQPIRLSIHKSVSSCSPSMFPPGCLGHCRPCTHPVCTQDTRPQQQSELWQGYLISCFSTNSVNTPHTNQQVQPRLSLYRPTVLNSKHPLLYLLTKEH